MRRLLYAVLVSLCACAEGENVSGPNTETVGAQAIPPQEAQIYKYALAYMQATTTSAVGANFDSAVAAVADLYRREGRTVAAVFALNAYNRARRTAGWTNFMRSEGLLLAHMASYKPVQDLTAGTFADFPVEIIYTNGIFTSADAAAVARQELEEVVNELGIPIKVILNYNSSSRYVDASKMCLYTSVQDWNSQDVSKCPGVSNDILEASRQIANLLWLQGASIEPDAERFANIVRQKRTSGKRVILVGHSQGTLYNAQVFKSLGRYDACIGGIELGSPLGRSVFGAWASDPGILVGDMHSSDVLKVLGFNDFPMLPTSVSAQAWIEKQKLSQLAVSYASIQIMMQDVKLHSFVESYMRATESREWIKNEIYKMHTRMTKFENCSSPAVQKVYAVSGSHGFASGPSDLWLVEPTATGQDSLIARIRTTDGFEPLITDVAQTPDGTLWGLGEATLYTINRKSGVATPVTTFSGFDVLNGMTASRSGLLYLVDTDHNIVSIDPVAKKIVWRGLMGSTYYSSGDLDFALDSKLYGVVTDGASGDRLALIDQVTGTPTVFAVMGCAEVWGLKFVGADLYGFTHEGSLVSIDPSNGKCQFIRKLTFSAYGAGKPRT